MQTPVIIAAAILMVSCARGVEPLPSELIGVWRSPEKKYSERYFELRPESVIFGSGKYTMDMSPLLGVTSESSRAPNMDTLYTLHYAVYEEGERESRELRVLYAAGPPTTLRFENRQEVWLREAAVALEPTGSSQ